MKIDDKWLATVLGESPSRVAIMEFGMAGREQVEDLALPRGQLGKRIGAGAGVAKKPQHPLRNARPEDRLTGRNRSDRPGRSLPARRP